MANSSAKTKSSLAVSALFLGGTGAFVPMVVIPALGIGMGPGILLAAFSGAVGASTYFVASEKNRIADHSSPHKDFDMQEEKQISKRAVTFFALYGAVLSGVIGGYGIAESEKNKKIESFPEISPHTLVEAPLHEFVCEPRQAGKKIRIAYDGRDYSIACPK